MVLDLKIIIKRNKGCIGISHMTLKEFVTKIPDQQRNYLSIDPLKIQIQMEFMKINKPLSAMNFEDVRRLLNGSVICSMYHCGITYIKNLHEVDNMFDRYIRSWEKSCVGANR